MQGSIARMKDEPDWTGEFSGVYVPSEYRDEVRANLDRIALIAKLLLDFPMEDDVEIAPVFEP